MSMKSTYVYPWPYFSNNVIKLIHHFLSFGGYHQKAAFLWLKKEIKGIT